MPSLACHAWVGTSSPRPARWLQAKPSKQLPESLVYRILGT